MTSKYDKQRRLLRIALLFLLLPAAISTATAQTRDPLADLKLPSATIVSVETVAAGAFKPPAGAFVLPGTDRCGMGMRRAHWAKSRPMFLPSHYFTLGPPIATARRSSLLRAADTWDWPRITKVGRSPTGSLHAASRPSRSNTGWDKNTCPCGEAS